MPTGPQHHHPPERGQGPVSVLPSQAQELPGQPRERLVSGPPLPVQVLREPPQEQAAPQLEQVQARARQPVQEQEQLQAPAPLHWPQAWALPPSPT